MSNIWHDINPARIQLEDFIAVIEIPQGSKKNMSWIKRPASSSSTGSFIPTYYPANYGFIPRTWRRRRPAGCAGTLFRLWS